MGDGPVDVPKRERDRPNRLRPLRTQEEVAEEPGRGLTAIDNPDDADLYPPTETPTRGQRRRRKDFPPRTDA